MKLSAKFEYAGIALVELARRYGSGEPVCIREIADANQIPSRFLVQILLQLKGAGLVQSTRGAAGGYQLAKPPAEISLGDVVNIVEGPPVQGLVGTAAPDAAAAKVLAQAWTEIDAALRDRLDQVTFAELAAQVDQDAQSMYYI